MSPVSARGLSWRSILDRWFVEYNPLYFASALSILAGVFLIARGLPPDAFASKLGVAASTEVYQLLLLAGAAVLLRAGLRRPAAILGITAFIFILDVAFNGERLMSFMGLLSLEPGMRARRAVPASLVFALLGPLKLWLLAHIFRLNTARGALAVCGTLLLALPLLPYVIELESTMVSVRQSLYLSLSWLGAPVLGWAFTRSARRWTSAWTEDEPDPWLTRRIAFAAPFLASALFAAHVIGWRSLSDLSLSPAQAAPYLLALTCAGAARLSTRLPRTAEFVGWAGAGATLWAAALPPSTVGLWPLAAMALVTGAALVLVMETTGARLFLPATVCVFGGAYMMAMRTAAPLPAPGAIWPAGLALALLAGAARHRDFRCLLVSALSSGATVIAVHPSSALLAYGGIVSGLWLAVASWILFPELRRWVPLAAAAGVLVLGGGMLWHEVPGIGIAYGTLAAASIGAGFALRRVGYHGAGVASGAWLAVLRHEAWVPRTSGGWGVTLVAAGFLLLSMGVAVNLLLARRRPRPAVPADLPTFHRPPL